LVDSQQIFYSETAWPNGSFGQAVSEEKIVYESTNQQHELPVLAMFVNRSKISNLYRGPSIDAIYHVYPLTSMSTTGNSCC
jgi:hypothetical protein